MKEVTRIGVLLMLVGLLVIVIVYGPLLSGARTIMLEGVPNYPTSSDFGMLL